MASTETKKAPEFDATAVGATDLPPFVRLPTGEYEVDDDGELVLEKGHPKPKSQAYLVRRTGSALKEIHKIETDNQFRAERELREEAEWWKREEAEEADDTIPADKKYKVDLDLVSERRKARANAGVDAAYRTLSFLLVHPKDGTHPDVDEMVETLDYMIVKEWTDAFVPQPPTVDEEGKPEETPTDAGSGTDPVASS